MDGEKTQVNGRHVGVIGATLCAYKIDLDDYLNLAPAAMSPREEWHRTFLATAEQVYGVKEGHPWYSEFCGCQGIVT